MSDAVAVMSEGKIVQTDEPRRLYEHPTNRFVADFIGAANLVLGTVVSSHPGDCLGSVRTPHGDLSCTVPDRMTPGDHVFLSIRPEDIQLSDRPPEGCPFRWEGEVEQGSFLGGLMDYRIAVGHLTLRARVHPSHFFRQGEKVFLTFQPQRCAIVPVDTG